mgnify:CR=1 FL=1
MLNLPKDKRYLLTCSYGPDSMALFDMLVKENYIFDVAHVNYGLRKEADQETSDLKAYSEKQNIPCHILKINDNLGTNNLENKCRKVRYEFFA